MAIIRVGTNEKYAEGWARAFGKGPKGKVASTAKKGSPKKRATSRKKSKK